MFALMGWALFPGMKIKRDPNKRHEDWQRSNTSGPDTGGAPGH